MTPHSLVKTFMPEGLCARCDNWEPMIWRSFAFIQNGERGEAAMLGFCTQRCEARFVRGMGAIKKAVNAKSESLEGLFTEG